MSEEDRTMLGAFRVIDLSDENGVFCSKLLADLGADVIKVEAPGGDRSRRIGPFYHDIAAPETSLFWFAYNVNKRGVTLNIETKDGQSILKRLVERADCVIESFAPGYLGGLGLGYSELCRINPRVVVTSITPFGQTGQYREYKACDLVIQAMSGWIVGEPDRAPLRWGGEQSFALPGFVAASGTIMALYARQMTGEGQHVDVSMRESMAWASTMPWNSLFWEFQKEVRRRQGNLSSRGAVMIQSIFPCADGHISWRIWPGALGHLTRRVVDWMETQGKAGTLRNVDWSHLNLLGTNQEEWDKYERAFGDFFLGVSKRAIYEAAREWGFIAVPVEGARGVVENPQLTSRGYFVALDHPELETSLLYPGDWFKSTVEPRMLRRRAPLIGEHNEEVYVRELGISRTELRCLRESGVI